MIDEKKLIKDLEKHKNNQRPYSDDSDNIMYFQVKDIINSQPQLKVWTPCCDRFPNNEEFLKADGRFIVTDGQRVYQSLYDIYELMAFCDVKYDINTHNIETIIDNRPIAWMPMPEPYRKR